MFRYGRRGRFTVERQVEAKAGQGVLDDAGDLSEPQGDEAAR